MTTEEAPKVTLDAFEAEDALMNDRPLTEREMMGFAGLDRTTPAYYLSEANRLLFNYKGGIPENRIEGSTEASFDTPFYKVRKRWFAQAVGLLMTMAMDPEFVGNEEIMEAAGEVYREYGASKRVRKEVTDQFGVTRTQLSHISEFTTRDTKQEDINFIDERLKLVQENLRARDDVLKLVYAKEPQDIHDEY